MPITPERARQLNLPLMVRDNRSQHETNFTVSIDATEQWGLASARRSARIPFVRRCHNRPRPRISVSRDISFRLVANRGGVLKRAGHTEAGVDLARMAGLAPAAVIVEIMNPDGTMARRPELEVFANAHQLNMGTIADLIEYRSLHEQSIELHSAETIHTEWGPFTLHTFRDLIDDTLHFAVSLGDLTEAGAVPVRVQPVNTLRDLLGTQLDAPARKDGPIARQWLTSRARAEALWYCWGAPRHPLPCSRIWTSCCMRSSDPLRRRTIV